MGDDIERRVGELEKDMRAIRDDVHDIKVDVAILKTKMDAMDDKLSNFATKADLADFKAEIHKEFTNQTKWMVATLLVAVGLVFAIQRAYPPKLEVPTTAAAFQTPAPVPAPHP